MNSLKEIKKLKHELESASNEKDPSLRGIYIASVLSEALSSIELDPILVGGSAVAFYTEGKYTTQDIDMVSPSGKNLTSVMQELGFKKRGKDFINKQLNIYIEFPSDRLGPTEQFDIIRIDNRELKIISIEDLIIDRICAYKYWKSAIDGLNTLMMLELGKADRDRLETRAREEDVLDALDYLEDTLERIIRQKLTPDEANELLEKFIR